MNAIHRIFKEGVAIERVNLTRATINEAHEIKDNLIDDIDRSKIIVDLSTCKYIDSTFFGAMVYAYRLLRHQGCAIGLVVGDTFLSRSFIYDEISSVFKVYHSMAEAMEALNNSQQKPFNNTYENVTRRIGPANIVQSQVIYNPE